ncbi:putative Zn cluster transcription factor Rds2 [Taphrina deformans PYCC 5710]|uniref:Zn cluster transcription factor Rds2 n=1 Tax=Taphrina deformans (strain PYCC 5710 / ATCC 11124 / CBS 356.35 / IMI 108563 / JCM 9778 / NBRC 8474) TaxID=1097556 RepID=R4X8Y6_TAPDE|nr:putative Zn cluster transcription factor Rds2 [Taphrina deformans PYCC 5710]|eukprot:CCG80607.1 putative Zn cluster transcription factor Rds2 [Taphrina deformans PYCC 5710]
MSETPASPEDGKAPGSSKRKKVNHACVYCRRSHMTCDSGRPCIRCVKRSIGHLCHDEVKEPKTKSPKLEPDVVTVPSRQVQPQATVEQHGDDNSTEATKMKPPALPASYSLTSHNEATQASRQLQALPQISLPNNGDDAPAAETNTFAQEKSAAAAGNLSITNNESSNFLNEFSAYYDTSLFGLPQDPYAHFASEHTNSEFLVLSDFLNIIDSPGGSIPSTPNLVMQIPGSAGSYPTLPEIKEEKLTAEQQLNLQVSTAKYTNHSSLPQSRAPSAAPSRNQSRRSSINGIPRPKNLVSENATPQEKFFLTAADPQLESPEDRLKSVINAKLEAGLMKPFNYVRGYARLQKYMDQNMSADSRSRILAPLSTFRPAFRAIAKRLTDVDLILVEEAFERLLLDYDRVFTSMAVPACLWRRTGEIFRGNKEFAALLNLPANSLRDGKLAITELMAEDSAVNYWEKYGNIAFDGQQKAVLTSCLLQVPGDPKGSVVSCCFSFTIKRDRYNIPSCIVGNFIPISF